MSETAKPSPNITDTNRPFWEAARHQELRLQRCLHCRHIRYPISPTCPSCLHDEVEWAAVSGRGEIFAIAIYHRRFGEGFTELPYALCIIQLDEGPRMLSDLVDGIEHAKVGDRVQVHFDRLSEEHTVPRFGLADE